MKTKHPLNFGNSFLNHILLNLITSGEFISKVRGTITLDMFKGRDKRWIAELCLDYFDEYKEAPGDHFYDLFEEYADDLDQKTHDRVLKLIEKLQDLGNSNWKYVASKIGEAVRHQLLEQASVDFAKMIKQQNYEGAKSVVLKAIRDPEDDMATWYEYGKDREFIKDRMGEADRYKMKFMIECMDNTLGGLNEPWLTTILGATKGGKSWMLIEFTIAAVIQGLNVVFISLEMGKRQIDERFDQAIGFMSTRPEGFNVEEEVMYQKMNGDWSKRFERTKTVYDINSVIKNRKALMRAAGGRLVIQAFNRGRMNHFDIEVLLDTLEQTQGFIPDLLVIDYLGLMKETEKGQSKKERISENCLGLKDLNGRRHMMTISAMQGNRKAMTAKTFESHMVADDIDTIFHSDLILAICQTKQEEIENRARLFVANNRNGAQHQTFGLIRDLNIGQIALGEYDYVAFEEEHGSDTQENATDYF
jgi:replicative DNA helicase